MMDYWNRVTTNIKEVVCNICPNVSSGNNDNPPGFPCVQVSQVDAPDTAEDLENNENAVESVVEVQTYSNKNLTESRNIMNLACDAMRTMGYRRLMGPKQVTNAADSNVFRVVARFSRIIGNGEEIELIDK